MHPSTPTARLSLERFSVDRHLALLEGWLADAEVAIWFADGAHQLAEATERPERLQSILLADGRPVGYARWQTVDPAALALLGLRDIPAGAVDLDLLLGEPSARGHGWGARFAELLCRQLLADPAVSMIGMVTSVDNRRALRAWEKAGLSPEQTYQDGLYGPCHVLTRRRSEISPARPSDQPDVVALLAAQLAEHDIALHREKLEQAVAVILADRSKGLILLACQHGTPVGVMCLAHTFTIEHGGPAWWLDELYVVPSWRGRAVGTELVRTAIALATSAGALALELEVEETHTRATHLYSRAGFRALSRQRWFMPLRPSSDCI